MQIAGFRYRLFRLKSEISWEKLPDLSLTERENPSIPADHGKRWENRLKLAVICRVSELRENLRSSKVVNVKVFTKMCFKKNTE